MFFLRGKYTSQKGKKMNIMKNEENFRKVSAFLATLGTVDLINRSLRGESFEYDSKLAAQSAFIRADKRSALVKRNSALYSCCQIAGSLNSEAQKNGKKILSRRYAYGDMKISQVDCSEAAYMI